MGLTQEKDIDPCQAPLAAISMGGLAQALAASPSPTSAAGLLQALFAAGLFCAAGFFNADGLSMPSKTSAPMQPLLALPRLDPAEELISSTKEEGDSSTSPESWIG